METHLLQTMFGRMGARVRVRELSPRVSHSDHKTIVLNDWHQVVMNTGRNAPGAPSILFLD